MLRAAITGYHKVAFAALFGAAIIKAQNLYLGYNGEKSTNLPVQEKLIVGILQAHIQAASNKTISSRQCHLERLRKGYSKTERSIDVSQAITKILSKLKVDFMHNALSQNINIMC